MNTNTNWAHLHQLTEDAAQYAPSWPPNFGGKGVNARVHDESTFGLAKLYLRASTAIHQAWEAIHKHGKDSPQPHLREMVYFALAAGRLHKAVVEALGGTPDPCTLCYTSDHGKGIGPQLHVQGLRWRWGCVDRGYVPAEAAEAFANGGSLEEFKAALDATADIRDGYDKHMVD